MEDGRDSARPLQGSPSLSRHDNRDMSSNGNIKIETESCLSADVEEPKLTKRGIWKNVLVVCVSFMLLFCSFDTLLNLQSTINREEGLGTSSMAALHLAAIISGLFLAPAVLTTLGCKWTMVVSMATYLGFSVANFYPTWATILTTSIVLGLSASCLWAAKMAYTNQLGIWYARLTGMKEKSVMNKFSGIFWAICMLSSIVGNVCSSVVLGSASLKNMTDEYISSVCGARYCPISSATNITTLQNQDIHKTRILAGILTGLSCVGVLMSALVLDRVQTDEEKKMSRGLSFEKFLMTMRHIWSSTSQKLLIPVTVYRGLELAFFTSDITLAFISCPFGVGGIGFIIIANGAFNSIFSMVFGHVAKFTGHLLIFMIGFATQAGVCITLLLWTPNIYYALLGFSAVWGIGDAVFYSTLDALYSVVFTETKAAPFSCLFLFEFLGWTIGFGMSGQLCTDTKIFIMLATMLVSLLGVIAVKIRSRRFKKELETRRQSDADDDEDL